MQQVSPICRCQHPKRIVNPYTNQSLIVPCGHCRACSLNRSNRLSLQCDLESVSHKHCLFVTLTYSNRFIPRAHFVDNICSIGCCDVTDKSTGELLSECDLNESDRQMLLDKFYLFGDIPYLRKGDLQKFLKRFRYYARKYTKEKIRYFGCGEYGPVHFRPHFHLLLYFSSEALLQVCSDLISKSWPFGLVDAQVTKGEAINYVSGYVNSTCTLPKIFKARALRPFCVHSQRLGQGFLESSRKEVYETSVEDFIRRGLQVSDKFKVFNLWRSCYSYFYPKCRGFADRPSYEITNIYRVYDYARGAFPTVETAFGLAKEIALTLHYFGLAGVDECFVSSHERWMFSYFNDNDSLSDINSEVFSRYVHRIYVELLISKHFLYYVCDKVTLYEINRKIGLIKSFYSRLDYLHLLDFFENQSIYFESDLVGDDDLMSVTWEQSYCPYFYDNVRFDWNDYKSSPIYLRFNSDVEKLFADRIKHKRLNDENKMFFTD